MIPPNNLCYTYLMNAPQEIPALLTVVTHRNWIAEEFASAGVIPVRQDFGFSAPAYPRDKAVAWWMSTEFAACLMRAGARLNLATISAQWLTKLPRELLLRDVQIGTLAQVQSLGLQHLAYCKPAEVKIWDAPAQWIEIDYFVEHLLSLGVPADTQIQFSSDFLDIKTEYRCFINDGKVATLSTYLNEGIAFGGEGLVRDLVNENKAKEFATYALSIIGNNQPIAYTLDVGQLSSGEFFVVEANPVWASNPYDCDKVETVKAIVAGSTTYGAEQTHGRFQWRPDPYLQYYSNKRPKLKLDYLDIEGKSRSEPSFEH